MPLGGCRALAAIVCEVWRWSRCQCWQAHMHTGARWSAAGVGIQQRHLPAVLLRNLLDDGQTQARAIGLVTQGAIKRLEHQLAVFRGDAGPVVLDLQRRAEEVSVAEYTALAAQVSAA